MQPADRTTGKSRGWVVMSPAAHKKYSAASLFHTVPKAVARMRRGLGRLCYLAHEGGRRCDDSCTASSFAPVAAVHASITQFLIAHADEHHYEACTAPGGGEGQHCAPALQEAVAAAAVAAVVTSGEEEEQHDITLREVALDIERTQLYALVHSWRQHCDPPATTTTTTDTTTITTTTNATATPTGHDSADAPPSFSSSSSLNASHVMTLFMLLIGNKLLEHDDAVQQAFVHAVARGGCAGGDASAAADAAGVAAEVDGGDGVTSADGPTRRRQLLKRLLDRDMYPQSDFPHLHRELALIDARFNSAGTLL